MKVHYSDERVTVYDGDCIEVLRALPDASVDSVVTDPPYGLEFMGKEWDKFAPAPMKKRSGWDTADSGATITGDSGQPYGRGAFHKRRSTYKCSGCGKRDGFRNPHPCEGTWQHEWVDELPVEMLTFQAWCQEWAKEALRVLRPGGHMLAFGGTRTWHRLACAIEDAGFEVRDSVAWLYGSGFPKSHNLRGTWQGWGTALKPAHEPIVVARKPLTGTVAANVLEHGTGALNIDGCRIGTEAVQVNTYNGRGPFGDSQVGQDYGSKVVAGRWPANVVLDEDQAAALDKQSGIGKGTARVGFPGGKTFGGGEMRAGEGAWYGDIGGASRFFYVAKAPASERPKVDGTAHPTVKPLTLMRWLCRLVTPPGGTILEPFAGSGTTIEAALHENFHIIAIERETDYLPLIDARINRYYDETNGQLPIAT